MRYSRIGDRDLVAQFNVVLHLGTPQVHVAILQAHLFVGQHGVGRGEGKRLAIVEDAQFVGDHFDLTGGDVLVHRAGIAQLDMADDGDHEFRTHRGRPVVNFGASVGRDDRLCDAAAVAQIEEDDVAEVAPLIDPSHEHNFGAGVGGAQFATHMSTFQVTKKIEHYCP